MTSRAQAFVGIYGLIREIYLVDSVLINDCKSGEQFQQPILFRIFI